MQQDAYAELEQALADAGSTLDAAEAHGCLCGALCAEASFPVAEWAAEVLPDDAEAADVAPLLDTLSGVREQTAAQLEGDDMDFQPVLPPDTAPLDQRVGALAEWCGGFLYGLGRAGSLDRLPGDLPEIMQDFSEISRAALAGGEADEAAERDYAELFEFVRASVQLAYAELLQHRSGAPAGGGRH